MQDNYLAWRKQRLRAGGLPVILSFFDNEESCVAIHEYAAHKSAVTAIKQVTGLASHLYKSLRIERHPDKFVAIIEDEKELESVLDAV